MEVMETSLDKFYPKVFNQGLTFPEEFLGKIAFSVGGGQLSQLLFFFFLMHHVFTLVTFILGDEFSLFFPFSIICKTCCAVWLE